MKLNSLVAVAGAVVDHRMAPLNTKTERLDEMSHALVEAIKSLKNVVVKKYKTILSHTQITFSFDYKLRK